ncbi:hypothetical protein ABZM71_004096 [Escherichia coli]|uniref:hypothetical protein n=1 Tax=Escherichia coli TaxID=562 RepID=UPI00117B4409|nr:hypothetical protein [Escherichia coli]HAW7353063.1 hypothetical protein [Escherichia coli]
MLSIIFYTFTFSYFDDAKEHNIIMADYHYLYEASEKTKRNKAVLTDESSLEVEVVGNDNGSNGLEKKLKNKKMLICINNIENKNYYYYENDILSAYPFKYNYNNIRNEILYMTGKKLPRSCQESTNRYILYR